MPTLQQMKQQADQAEQDREHMRVVIGGQALNALGQPDNLQRLQVRHLWEGYYRLNVYIGADATSAKVVHSYFLSVDGDGTILTSVPTITRQYEHGR